MKNILIIFLVFPLGIIAQNTQDIITLDLLSPVYINREEFTPRWRLGFIKNLNDNNKIGIDIGYGNSENSLIDTGENYTLFEIRPEYYRIINPKKKTLKYFALEFLYINQKQVFITDTYLTENKEFLRFDQANYKRNKFGLIPKFGMFINLSNRIGMNLYSGIGIKYRINTYTNIINPILNNTFEEHFQPYFREEGRKLGIEFTFGLKLYYRI